MERRTSSSVLRRSDFRGAGGLLDACGPFLLRSPDPQSFRAVTHDFAWAGTRVQHLRATVHAGRRASEEIGRYPEDCLVVECLLAGRIRASYAGLGAELQPGAVTIRRGDGAVSYRTQSAVEVVSVVLPPRACEPLIAMRDGLRDGPVLGSRLADAFGPFAAAVVRSGPVDDVVVARHLVDSLAALALATVNDAVEMAPPLLIDRAELRGRVYRFIADRLADTDLAPAMIAAEFDISVRSLHALFDDEPETLARYIRNRRLDGVRAQLLTGRAVSMEMLREEFGFSSADQMRRAFRRRFGLPVGDVRSAAD